jgi:hypothetical protein
MQGRVENIQNVGRKDLEGRDHSEDLGIDRGIILE